ncbi:Transcription initiation factor TFIID subunit 3 [Nakaseomyces bracarensis]|uniref:Transcription initiation factor TFIID subunit 3 n=1 Tax=Nakaseomyces bracarensis TaxID=273131 RepID=A0ABR4NXV0_9SACH
MSSNEAFFYGLLRVSMLQLLRATGFDRALPATVDSFTDLYVKYLELLTGEVRSVMEARGGGGVAVQDLTLALQNLKAINPVDVLDVYGERDLEASQVSGIESFKRWCVDEQNRITRQVAIPSVDLLTAEGDGFKTTKPLSAIPEYINQLQQQREPTPPSKQQQSQSQPQLPLVQAQPKQPMLPPLQQQQDEHEHELIEELINNGETDDWIRMVLARQRIELGKKHSNMSGTLENLPNIPSLKFSSLRELASSREDGKNELLPTTLNETLSKEDHLLRLLPIKRPEDRLDNIILSFEEPAEDSENEEDMTNEDFHSDSASPSNVDHVMVDEEPTIPLQQYENIQDGIDIPMDYQLDNPDAIFDEQEDMDNTFQRRASLDFGNEF